MQDKYIYTLYIDNKAAGCIMVSVKITKPLMLSGNHIYFAVSIRMVVIALELNNDEYHKILRLLRTNRKRSYCLALQGNKLAQSQHHHKQ